MTRGVIVSNNKNLFEYSVAEFIDALKKEEINIGKLVPFVDCYGVHKFFVELRNVVGNHTYMFIAYSYHFEKNYFDEHK